jgi:hypothetical protein
MEVAELTARLEAHVGEFMRNMQQADALIAGVRRDLGELATSSRTAQDAMQGVRFANGQVGTIVAELDKMENALGDTRVAADRLSGDIRDVGFGPGQVTAFVAEAKLMQNALDGVGDKARRVDSEIQRVRFRSSLGTFLPDSPPSLQVINGVPTFVQGRSATGFMAGQGGAPGNSLMLYDRSAERAFTRGYSGSVPGSGGGYTRPYNYPFGGGETGARRLGGMFYDPQADAAYQIRRTVGGGDSFDRSGGIAAAERYLRMHAGSSGADGGGRGTFAGSGGHDHGSDGGYSGGLLGGILPGGRRASAGAVTTGIGILAGLAPAVVPSIVGLAAALPQMAIGAAGAFGVVKLALADVSKQAFETQKEFDKLTKSQQGLVHDLRSLDAGLVKQLEARAQSVLIPAFHRDLRNLVTPGSVGMLQGGVNAFSGAVSRSTGDVSKYLGGPAFTSMFGDLLRRNAGYLSNFGTTFVHVTDALLRFLQASKPFTDWLDRTIQLGAVWLDTWSRMEQQTGGFDSAARAAVDAFRNLGAIVYAVGGAVVALYNAVGGGGPALQLVVGVFDELTAILTQNRGVLNDFFKGAGQSINDVLHLVEAVNPALKDMLAVLNEVASLLGGWRVVIDAVAIAWVARLAAMKLGVTGLVAELLLVPGAAATAGVESAAALATPWSIATKTATAEVTGLRAALLGLQGMLIPITIGLSVVLMSSTVRDFGNQILSEVLGALPGGDKVAKALGIDAAAVNGQVQAQTAAANKAGTHVPLSQAPAATSSQYGWNMPAATGVQFATARAQMLGFNSDQTQMLQNMFQYEDASGAPGDYGKFVGGKFVPLKAGTPGGSPTSFGPFQLHAGDQLPAWVWAKGPAFAQQWAWSRSGINYALEARTKFAGLKGSAFAQALANYQGSSDISAEYTAIMGGAGGSGDGNPYGTPEPLDQTGMPKSPKKASPTGLNLLPASMAHALLAAQQAVAAAQGGPLGHLGRTPMYSLPGQHAGMLAAGNIDLANRQVAHNADGSISTVRSIDITQDGRTVSIPTVINGRVVSNAAAIAHYKRTGQNLGTFASQAAANAYDVALHNQQARMYSHAAPGGTGQLGAVAGERDAAQQALDYLEKQHATGKKLIAVERERVVLQKEIAKASKEIGTLLEQQRKNEISDAERKALGIDAGGAAATPSLLALRSQTKAVQAELAKTRRRRAPRSAPR